MDTNMDYIYVRREINEIWLLFALRYRNYLYDIPAYNENIKCNGMFHRVCIYINNLLR